MENVNAWMLFDGYLILYIIQKFIFTAMTLACPLPGGIFTPTFAIGAVFGQLYVSCLRKILLYYGYTGII
jgi:H+/Cl- antiporter ClcA